MRIMALSDDAVVSSVCRRYHLDSVETSVVLFIHGLARGKTIDDRLWRSEQAQEITKRELTYFLRDLLERLTHAERKSRTENGLSKLAQNSLYRAAHFAFYNNRVRAELGRATEQYVIEFLMAEKSE